MTSQLDLEFRAEAPEVSYVDVEKFIAVLKGRGWRTARALGATTEAQKRALRAIAEASEGQIISGQKGYKLTLEATIEEIDGTDWLKSQGKKMIGRWLDIQRVRHGRPKRKQSPL